MFYKKLLKFEIWSRIFKERLTEPIHLNILSLFIYLFGTYRTKILFDLIMRQHHAYGIDRACQIAKYYNHNEISILEFGVANGAGLINMQEISNKLEKIYNIKINIYGFDMGNGMPRSKDKLKDHPDIYSSGDFPMDIKKLKTKIGKNPALLETSKTMCVWAGSIEITDPGTQKIQIT